MISRTGNRGLTLVEVLMAVAILGIGIVSVLQAYGRSITALESGQFTIDGTNLAKEKMVEAEQEIAGAEKIASKNDEGAFEEPFERFLWKWEIAPSETEGLYMLSLVVSHQDDSRTFGLKTYVLDKEFEKKEE